MLFHMLQTHKNIRKAVINDINPDLIRCYKLIKDRPDELIDRLELIESVFYNHDVLDKRELYYAYRDQYNQSVDSDEKASLLIFLNHTCFNGLYRVNASGLFNVPYGRYKNPTICNKEVIMEDHRLFNSIDLIIRDPGDYKLISSNLSPDGLNFVYFDPPYRPLLNESNFKSYSYSPFSDIQQEELKLFCDELTERGVRWMQSNSDSKNEDGKSYFEVLYDSYAFQIVYAPRVINAFGKGHGKITESLIRNP